MPCESKHHISALIQVILGIVLVLVTTELISRGLRAYSMLASGYSRLYEAKYELMMHTPDRGKPTLIIIGDSFMYYAFYPELMKAALRHQGMDVDIINLATQGVSMAEQGALMRIAATRFKHPIFFVGVSLANTNIGCRKKIYLPIGDTMVDLNHRTPNFLTQCIVAPQSSRSWGQNTYCTLGHISHFVRFLLVLIDLVLQPYLINYAPDLRRRDRFSMQQHLKMSPLGGGIQAYRPDSLKALIYHMVEPNYIIPYGEYQYFHTQFDLAYPSIPAFPQQSSRPIYFIFLPFQKATLAAFSTQAPIESAEAISQKAAAYAKQRRWVYWDCHDQVPDVTLYKDNGHFNLAGTVVFTQWMSTQLKPVINASLQGNRTYYRDPCSSTP